MLPALGYCSTRTVLVTVADAQLPYCTFAVTFMLLVNLGITSGLFFNKAVSPPLNPSVVSTTQCCKVPLFPSSVKFTPIPLQIVSEVTNISPATVDGCTPTRTILV